MTDERELKAAAEHGDTTAMLKWGNILMKKGSVDEAITWWEKAEEGGRSGGAYNLARHYSGLDTGKGNAKKMLEWLNRLAYAHNDGWGMVHLGIILCGGTHQIWRKMFTIDDFGAQRNTEEGLRLIVQGVRRAESSTQDLTLYDYDAAAEVVRAYSGSLGVEVLKLALAYKTKARGLIPPGYKAMSDAANIVITELQSELAKAPVRYMPTRVSAESIQRTQSDEMPRTPTRVVPAPMPRQRTVARHVPPPNDVRRRDPRAGFGLGLQIMLAFAFMCVAGAVFSLGLIPFEQETFVGAVRLRVILYGVLAVVGLGIATLSGVYRWGAYGSGKGIATLVMLGALYSAAINTAHAQTGALDTAWDLILFDFVGKVFITIILTGLLMALVAKIYDSKSMTRVGKAFILLFMAGALGGGMFYVLWQVEHPFIDFIIPMIRSVPFVLIALMPGALFMRWAEDIS